MDDNGINAWQLAALFSSSRALCDAILVAPRYLGTYTQRATVSDQWLACDAAVRAGQAGQVTPTTVAALAVAAIGAAGVLAWAANHRDVTNPPLDPGCTEDDTCGPPPSQPPTAGPGTPLPGQVFPTSSVAAAIGAKNDRPLTNEQVESIATECIREFTNAGYNANNCGSIPIFVTGGNVMEATDLDLYAITQKNPLWAKLNYDGIEKDRSWMAADSRCAGQTSQDVHCHEFPYNKTEQGGRPNDPAIRPIPASVNRSQGGYWSGGLGASQCDMRPAQSDDVRGDEFVVVPLPALDATFWLCNGKSTLNQPPQPPR